MRTRFMATLLLCAMAAFAKTAHDYFLGGANLYVQAKFPTASLLVKEGLQQYPNDQKLQWLNERIEDAQKEQKKQNDKQNPGSSGQGSSSSNNKNQSSSSLQNGSSQGPQSMQGASSSSEQGGSSSSAEPELQEGQLSKEQAEQLLKDYKESEKDRKRNTLKARGVATPEKDW